MSRNCPRLFLLGLKTGAEGIRTPVRKYFRNSVYTVSRIRFCSFYDSVCSYSGSDSHMGIHRRLFIVGDRSSVSAAYLAAFALFSSKKSSRGRDGHAAIRSGASLLNFSADFYTGLSTNQSVQLKPPIPRRCQIQPRKRRCAGRLTPA